MSTIDLEDDMQQLGTNLKYKISGIEIELKEKQFMADEDEYYKEVKTKSKKNAHAEDKETQIYSLK
ncbi:hypothetical protein [Methylobacter sp.]|uniref:hypothetical protein n=1 Tax=Methylobacter sp. TaxID=2051955 RepID=UPI002FDED83A